MGTSDRFPYTSATVLDQSLLDVSQDNLTIQLEMICEIETPTGTIYASDRNKYVGGTFYEALLTFPVIRRTVGEWLSTDLEFSTIELSFSNVDGRFNSLLPGGSGFGGWIGKTVVIKMGLRDVAATYTTIFSGVVTDVGGFGRDVKSIRITARDKFDSVNVSFPSAAFTRTSFPDIEDENVGKIVPEIYGDFTTAINPQASSVPAFVVNGADANVIGGTRDNIELRISNNDNTVFDSTTVYLLRGSEYFLIDSADVVNVSVGKNAFEIDQDTGNTLVDGVNYVLNNGDQFFCRVKGKDLGSGGIYDDNIIEIARDILITHGGLVAGDFDANWDTYRDKAAPAESAISAFKARVWIQEPQTAMEFALSLLEQVRLEAFISRDLKVKIGSLHFDDFVAPGSISYNIRNVDIIKNTFNPNLDTRNNFNRARAEYSFLPDENANTQTSATFKNIAAITQAGKQIDKKVIFPNLYVENDVELQLKEILKLSSSYLEIIDLELTWRALLLDIGDFVKLNVNIGSTVFSDIPAFIRDIGYDPAGFKIPAKIFSLQMTPYPGFSPGFTGIVGGSTATITEET